MRRFVNKIERADVNLPCGTVAEEIELQSMTEDIIGGASTRSVVNNGGACIMTNESQPFPGVVHYTQWGAFCK